MSHVWVGAGARGPHVPCLEGLGLGLEEGGRLHVPYLAVGIGLGLGDLYSEVNASWVMVT